MSEVTRLRATLSLESRLQTGLRAAKTELTNWARQTKGWAKPVSDDAKKAGKEITDEMKKAQAEANKIAYKMGQDIGNGLKRGIEKGGTMLTIGLTLPLLALAKTAITAASDLNESMGKVDVTFGTAQNRIVEFGKTSAEAFGISTKSAYDFTSTFGGILRETGLGKAAIATMSVQMVKLGGDIASFKNLKPEEALEKLRSAITGEYEPLKNIGYVLNEHIVQLKAVELGYKGQVSQMTEAQKMLARYALILQKTKDSAGDFGRTQSGVANQERILKAEMENQLALFGKELIPLTKEAIIVGRNFIKMFADLTSEQRQQILKWVALAAAMGPALKLLQGLLTVIRATVALRTAYLSFQAAAAAANGVTAASAGTAAAAVGALRLAMIGLIALAAVPILITVKAVYDYKDAADSAWAGTQKAAAQPFSLNDYIKGRRGQGDKRSEGDLVNAFKKSQWYKPFMNSGYRGQTEAKANAEAAAKAQAEAEAKAFEDQMKKAFANAGNLSGKIGKGGSGGGAKAIKEVATEYDYWGRVMQKAAESGFAPFRVVLSDIVANAENAENPFRRISDVIKSFIENGNISGARKALTDFVDSLKVEPKEIETIVSAVIGTLGDGNEAFKATISASIGEARNLSAAAKAAMIETAKLNDLRKKSADIAKANSDAIRAAESAVSDAIAKTLDRQRELDDERIQKGRQLAQLATSELMGLKERISLLGKDTEMDRLKYRLREGDLKGVTAITAAYLLYNQQIFDNGQAILDAKTKMDEFTKAQNENGQSRYDEYIKSLTERLMELDGAYDQLLRKQLASELTTMDPKKKQEQIDEILRLKKVVQNAEILSGYLNTFADGAAQIFANLFTDIGQGWDTMFKNALSGFRDLLNQIAMEILKSQAKALILKVLGSVFGGDWGGAKAAGGPVSSGRPYLVGENGPEMFVPGGSGKIVPNSQLPAMAGAGGGTVINVSVSMNIASGANSQDIRSNAKQIAAEMGRAVNDAIARDYGRRRS